MPKVPERTDFPVSQVRRYLEPRSDRAGVIKVAGRDQHHDRSVGTRSWNSRRLWSGLMISGGNHSHHMIRESRECVVNLPTTALTDTVVGIGNTSGAEIDKFAKFNLTRQEASKVDAPLIGEYLYQLRMPPSRRRAGRQVQFLHLRGGEGACRHVAKASRRCITPAMACSWCPARSSAADRCF